MNSIKSLRDKTTLKNILFFQPEKSVQLLEYSLEIIFLMSLHLDITYIKIPLLRIYRVLDHLVPKKIINILNKK
ncbi:MAG: hypothetical protein G4A98_02730 [Buchnera aphidicola (Microlophium carnosum)]|uniref:Uncharacterized protein n=1 Tax=Buchnera aphidicola (Microlophium carnosum) TaxID=2708354 RepID=A0A6G9JTL1_9GAMM|nr:MAG: hypothetical protein G4A98_02730 [Buchnera aphidicola (Microlophium carnosum)]